MTATETALRRLSALSEGLVYSSEGDHPFESVHLGPGDIRDPSPDEARRLLSLPPETQVTFVTLERALGRHTVYTDPSDVEAQGTRPRYEAIQAFFESELSGARVVRTGRAPLIDVWMLGHTADDEIVGYHTVAVET